MRVLKWGKSLALRIPPEMAQSLDLKEGDEVTIRVARETELEASRSADPERPLQKLCSLRRPFPPGFRFDRDEENSR